MNKIHTIYKKLLKIYGPQGWWPIINYNGENPTKTGSVKGYHPGDYSFPRDAKEKFEICMGAILTQNTAWSNVEIALQNLEDLKAIDPNKLINLGDGVLKKAIRPAGYFNQKANYVKEFTRFYIKLKNKVPSRNELLSIKGIGNETADSILLYAFKQLEFVVDAYTKRIFVHLKLIEKKDDYVIIKGLFENSLPKDLILYQEYHALIDEHAKWYYKKKDQHFNCPLHRSIK